MTNFHIALVGCNSEESMKVSQHEVWQVLTHTEDPSGMRRNARRDSDALLLQHFLA
jgi:hypothetical protein